MKKGKKKQNTFKFQNFAERLANLNIDIYHSVQSTNHEVPENDKDTFFRESLENWAELNCSLDFTEFYRNIKPFVQSFNQLVFHKNQVIDLLLKYLNKKDSLALEPCLHLLSQLSRDLIQDFYPHFEDFFTCLVKLLDCQDAKLIENTFVSMAYIFKFNWRYMINDLANVFRLFKCLLEESQKKHIQVFAAESFAYLVRKSKNKNETFDFILEELKISEELCYGIGTLIFYTIKGIKGQLNLNAGKILKYLCNKLINEKDGKNNVDCITVALQHSLNHSTNENVGVVFDVLFEIIECSVASNEKNINTIENILHLLNYVVTFKDGQKVTNPLKLYKVLVSVMSVDEYANTDTLKSCITSYLLNVNHISDDHQSSTVEKYLFHNSITLQNKLDFSQTLFQWIDFSRILKPLLVKYISSCITDQTTFNIHKTSLIEFLVNMIHVSENWLSEIFSTNLNELCKIDFQENSDVISSKLCEEINNSCCTDDSDWLWMLVLILSSCETTSSSTCETLHNLMKQLLYIADTDNYTARQLFLLSYLVRAIVILDKQQENCLEFEKLTAILLSHQSNQHVLQCYEFYVSMLPANEFSTFYLNKERIYDCLKLNINTPNVFNRLLTLNILKSYEKSHSQVFETIDTCVQMEKIETTLQTYREKLLHAQKLVFNTAMTEYEQNIIVRYLIGNLFLNFSLLWEPITKVLITFANSKCKIFWDIFTESLNMAADQCQVRNAITKYGNSKYGSLRFQFDIVKSCYEKSEKFLTDERADFYNFRMLLWKAMDSFSGFVETKSKDIVPLFLNFLSEECLSNDEMLAKKQNLSAANSNDSSSDEDDKTLKISHKIRLQTLSAKLKLFSSFSNPKALKKEPTLYKLYLDLLTYKDHDIQNLALNCLMTYKFPYLKSYKENFAKLMTDANFRDELLQFSSEGEDAIVKAEHREDLMPILIRLLYGKLQRKSGFGVAGKSSASARRNIIMQFLCNCSNNHLKTFIDLICEPFTELQALDISTNEVDIKSVVPLRKQVGFLNMLSNILTRLNRKAEVYYQSLFDILLKILWSTSQLLQCREKIKRKYVNRIKEIKQLGLQKLNEFFETVLDFPYQSLQEVIFVAAIWPNVGEFATTSSHNITSLMRLISTWSKISHYQEFLILKNSEDKSLLNYLFSILKANSMSDEVEKEIMMISMHLLNDLQSNEKEHDLQTSDEDSVGIVAIKPFISDILNYIHMNINTKLGKIDWKKNKKIGSVIPKLQLNVLSRISGFITDGQQCGVIIKVLFPLLSHISAEETQIHILASLNNLLQYINETEQYLHLVPPLLSFISNRKPRQMLCQVFVKLSHSEESLSIAQLISDTNSWDTKRLDEPDYEKRLNAFRILTKGIFDRNYNIDQLLLITQNCLHFLMTSEDMALQDTTYDVIESIIKIIDQEKEIDFFYEIIIKAIFPAIKNGVKLKRETSRFMFINLLSKIIKKFEHESFNDMKCLLSTEQEKDFFANITHIQLHRRSKALQFLQSICKNDEINISVKNWFTLIIPMVSHTVFEKLSSSKDHNLLTETITTIGMITRMLPWSKYAHILRNYLKLMQKDKDRQKTIIRMVVVVLDNFHFELKNVELDADMKIDGPGKDISTINSVKSSDTNSSNDADFTSKHERNSEDEETMENDESSDKTAKDKRVCNALVQKILPQLTSFVRKKAGVDTYHKLSKNKEEDEEEILKVPVIYAVVKLLQQLPTQVMNTHLPGLLLRVSQSLRSQARNVRDMTRDTLIKISKSLGATYLPLVIKEMRSVLLRGYQLHILGYSLHSILDALQPQLTSNELDACAKDFMEVVIETSFGTVAEEKEVAGITTKLHEAKSKKSSDIIEILAKYVSSNYLLVLLNPLSEILVSTQNHKTAHKVEEALRKISVGLHHNKSLEITDILLFINGILTNNISLLKTNVHDDDETMKSINEKYIAPVNIDIHEMPPLPNRAGKAPIITKQVNEHIVIEFALHLLSSSLKRQKLQARNEKHIAMLESLVPLLLTSLSSQYNKVVTEAAKSFSYLVKFPLVALKTNVNILAKDIFKILKKFSRVGSSSNAVNFEMVSTAFKTMTVLIREYKEFKASTKQIEILLTFIEEDLVDSSKQASALPLLKAILSRKYTSKDIEPIMLKVRELSIRSRDKHAQLSCRQAMLQYLLDYQLGKKIMDHLNFYLTQLTYEDEQGRVSSLEMLAYMFNNFPEKLMLEHSLFFFLPLTMLLSNDESATCRKMAAAVLKLLLKKVDLNKRDEIFQYIINWLTNDKLALRQVSVQLLGLFVETEGEKFERRLQTTLEILINILNICSDHVDIENESEREEAIEDQQGNMNSKPYDKMLYNTLTTFGKLFMQKEMLLSNKKYMNQLMEILEKLKEFLLHAHVWIRIATSQLYSLYFASISLEDITTASEKRNNYFSTDTHEKVNELCLFFISQVHDENATDEITEQATKNLIYLGKLVKLLDLANDREQEESEKKKTHHGMSVKILVKKICQLSTMESTKYPKSVRRRTCVYRWIAALVMFMSEEEIQPYLASLLRPIHRELSTGTDNSLNTLAQEVIEVIRSKINRDIFATSYAKVQRQVADTKEFRKRKIAEEAIQNPEKFARRKQKANLAKKEQKKRKLYEQKPNLKFKKIKSKPEM